VQTGAQDVRILSTQPGEAFVPAPGWTCMYAEADNATHARWSTDPPKYRYVWCLHDRTGVGASLGVHTCGDSASVLSLLSRDPKTGEVRSAGVVSLVCMK
jgi:hypothetical protein